MVSSVLCFCSLFSFLLIPTFPSILFLFSIPHSTVCRLIMFDFPFYHCFLLLLTLSIECIHATRDHANPSKPSFSSAIAPFFAVTLFL
ncbi:unnamed protein product [Cylicocyclus nassatus]|uniref:Uncharacterized protein n=1 Tax=Cylicocyclus nassatus TaxID=53992 RepID=A0AA36GVG9_CYLNA|nr:unnamed protein product [Cylicocyclus nassatus]